jgi:hypothetical protein
MKLINSTKIGNIIVSTVYAGNDNGTYLTQVIGGPDDGHWFIAYTEQGARANHDAMVGMQECHEWVTA